MDVTANEHGKQWIVVFKSAGMELKEQRTVPPSSILCQASPKSDGVLLLGR